MNKPLRGSGHYILLLALCVTPASAQQSLASYWTRLESATSMEELHRVAAPEAVDRELAAALLRLRRYELGLDRTEALVARTHLERLTARSTSASAHFALGLTLARGPDVRIVVGDDASDYFMSPYSNAAKQAPRALKRALELDPTLNEAAWVLAELALDAGDRPLMRDALRALDHPARAGAARTQILRSRMLALLDELVGAARAADSARVVGADPSLAAHLKAAALLRRKGAEAEATQAYFEGVASLTETSAATYFAPLAAVVSSSERQRWEKADVHGKREWLHRFWDVQAALSGVPLPERLAEHYRRLGVISRDGRVGQMGAGPASAARQVGALGDMRGLGINSTPELLLLRHGDPLRAERVRYCGKEVLEIPLPLAPSPRDCARSAISRMRERNAVGGSQLADQALARAVPGTSHYPPFRTHLYLAHEMLQFRGVAGQTDLIASVGVPSSSARDLVTAGVIAVRMELALVDTAESLVVRHDTLRSFRVGELPDQGWVLLASTMSVGPRSAQLYRLGVMDPESTTGRIVGGALDVRSFAGDSLMLSDVLMTPEDGVPSFARGDVRLSLAPGREFRTDERFTLYYELYGVVESTAYRTEIVIRPRPDGIIEQLRALFPGAREAVRLSFDETAAVVHDIYGVQHTRSVAIDGLMPGSYDLRITVTDAQGRVATRERTLHVAQSQ